VIDKVSNFSKIQSQYRQVNRLNKNIVKEYVDGIQLTYKIIQALNKAQHREFQKTKTPVAPFDSLMDFYEVKIAENFVAHKELLKSGIVISSYSHLRTIYETFLVIYLCKTYPQLGKLKLDYELVSYKTLAEQKQIKEEYKNKRWLKTEFIEKQLYNQDMQVQVRKFYKQLCEYAHPSINGLATSFEFRPKIFKDSLTLGISLLHSNFVILCELYGDKIQKRHKKKMFELIKKYYAVVQTGLINFIPEKETDKLLFGEYDNFMNFIKH